MNVHVFQWQDLESLGNIARSSVVGYMVILGVDL